MTSGVLIQQIHPSNFVSAFKKFSLLINIPPVVGKIGILVSVYYRFRFIDIISAPIALVPAGTDLEAILQHSLFTVFI